MTTSRWVAIGRPRARPKPTLTLAARVAVSGYYVERTVEDGTRYCRGKVMEIKDQVGELSRVLQQRQQILSRVEVVLAQKVQG